MKRKRLERLLGREGFSSFLLSSLQLSVLMTSFLCHWELSAPELYSMEYGCGNINHISIPPVHSMLGMSC
jgi:hypothetical protein